MKPLAVAMGPVISGALEIALATVAVTSGLGAVLTVTSTLQTLSSDGAVKPFAPQSKRQKTEAEPFPWTNVEEAQTLVRVPVETPEHPAPVKLTTNVEMSETLPPIPRWPITNSISKVESVKAKTLLAARGAIELGAVLNIPTGYSKEAWDPRINLGKISQPSPRKVAGIVQLTEFAPKATLRQPL